MKNIKAFPRSYSHDERPGGGYEGDRVETFEAQDGMTLRDYFAAKVLQALLMGSIYPFGDKVLKQLTEETYKVADAMLDAREKEGAA